ncbi:MAG TPA: carbohydrate kinase family protein [Thermomicrobiales bacterium]|nr:carbohydrate kinase family protein [Thermomicrobiales bacterium]
MSAGDFSRLRPASPDADGAPFAPVVHIGAACLDIKGIAATAELQAGTSNPGRVRFSFGGTARNIAENLARLDVPARLLTAVGDDGEGRLIVAHTRAAGVAVEDAGLLVTECAGTSAYLALLRADGRRIAGVDDTRAVRAITPRVIHRWHHLIRDASLVVADANLRPQSLRAVVALCRRYGIALCLDPVSAALTGRIAPFLADTLLITPNMLEAEILSGRPVTTREEALAAARALQERGPAVVVVTMAHGGAVYASADASGHVPAVKTEIVDATGAGDALTAGVLFGLLNDFPLDDAIALGAAMASLTMQSSETVRSDLTLEQVYQDIKL